MRATNTSPSTTTDEIPDRVIDRNKSLPGALGNAYERVKEILSGYTQIGGPPPRPKGPNTNGHGNGNGHRPNGAPAASQRNAAPASATAAPARNGASPRS